MVEVIWREMPEEVRAVVEPLLEKHLHRVPSWCNTLAVTSGSSSEARVVATVEADYEYRQARISFTPLFLSENKKNRESTIVHELAHLPLAPIRDWVLDTIKALLTDETMQQYLFAQYHKLEEGAVQDITHSVLPTKPATNR
jgi:hypothetical protein